MTFELRLSREAEQDLEQIYIYLFELSPDGADRLFLALMSAMTEIREAPSRWAYFRLTGPPRRARLVSLGRRRIWYRLSRPRGGAGAGHSTHLGRSPEPGRPLIPTSSRRSQAQQRLGALADFARRLGIDDDHVEPFSGRFEVVALEGRDGEHSRADCGRAGRPAPAARGGAEFRPHPPCRPAGSPPAAGRRRASWRRHALSAAIASKIFTAPSGSRAALSPAARKRASSA